MYWLPTAVMLEEKGFQRLVCNHQEINFYFKDIDGVIHILILMDTTKRYFYEKDSFINLRDELERKFLLRGAKDIQFLFIVYANNLQRYKALLDSGLNIWIVNVSTRSLMIFENQPDDFLDLKASIEESIKEKVDKKSISRPYVSIALIIINVLVYLIMYVFSGHPEAFYEYGANTWPYVFVDHEYYRLITCVFLHSGIDHLVNNMLTLGVLGNETEHRLGHVHFTLLYLITGVLSSLASGLYYMHASSNTIYSSVGASGAIFGIFGAFVTITLLSSSTSKKDIPFSRIILVTVLMLCNGFTGENIDNMAHLAGLISGIIISFIYCKCDKSVLKY